MSPRGRPASMPPSLSASGPISVTPRSSHPTDSSRSARARSASGLMCTREPLPSGCLRQLSSKGARRIGADTCPAGRPVGDACASTPRVPSPSRRRRTFPLPVAPTRANVDRRPPPVDAGKENPRPWTHTTRLGQPAPRRCCMKTICGWGGVARTSRDPPQEPHYRDAVEGPSHV